jgi:hypothetical protein
MTSSFEKRNIVGGSGGILLKKNKDDNDAKLVCNA